MDSFGAGQIELAGQESTQGELAGLGGAATRLQELSDQQFHKGWTREQMNFGEVLPRITMRRGPEVDVRWDRSQVRQTQVPRQQGALARDKGLRRDEQWPQLCSGGRTADTDNGPSARSGRCSQSNNSITCVHE